MEMGTVNGIKSFYPKDRKDWRKWLEKNHEKEETVWLIMYNKKSSTQGINYEEAVQEALCFGWIDSKKIKRDEVSAYQFFSKRKPKSAWSKINKDRVKKLISQGMVKPAGMKMIELAKKTGTWTILKEIDAMVIPEDLQKEFKKSKTAHSNFQAFPPSSKKIILGWIMAAKRPETREKRIKEAVTLAGQNIRANHYTPKNTKAGKTV